jgi:hypothetical protein
MTRAIIAALLAFFAPALANDLPDAGDQPSIPAYATLYKTLADCSPDPTRPECLKAVVQFYAAWVHTPVDIRKYCIATADKQEEVNSMLGVSKPHVLWACIEAMNKARFGEGAQ